MNVTEAVDTPCIHYYNNSDSFTYTLSQISNASFIASVPSLSLSRLNDIQLFYPKI